MGRRLKVQRRGKGSPKYSSTHHAKADIRYKNYSDLVKGQVLDIVSDAVRSAPLAKVLFEDGSTDYFISANGLYTGKKIEVGKKASHNIGNVLSLEDINAGTEIFNIERNFGDGGKFVRASGQYGVLVSKKEKAYVKMPSGKIKIFPLKVRATIGVISGSGRDNKPFVKAGNKFKAMKARGKPFPKTRGVAMNAVDHPHGGLQHHVGRSKSVSRHKSSGRKVGAISSKRTGRKKK